jgi:diguanylate cyclase (GGDEF)-like protein
MSNADATSLIKPAGDGKMLASQRNLLVEGRFSVKFCIPAFGKVRRVIALGVVAGAFLSAALLLFGSLAEAGHTFLAFTAVVVATIATSAVLACLACRAARLTLVRRLSSLADVMRNAEAGDYQRRFPTGGDDEFADVERTYNALMDQVSGLAASALHSDLMVKWAQSEIRLREELMAKSNELASVNEALVRKVREASNLLRIAEVASTSLEMGRMLDRLGQTLVETLAVEELLVLMPDPDTGVMRVRQALGVLDKTIMEGSWPAGLSMVGRCSDEGEIQYVPDLSIDPIADGLRGRRRTGGSLVAVPVRGPAGTTAVITLLRREANAFDPQELDFLRLASHYVALAVSNATLYRATHERAIHDSMTGLHNRGYFMEAFSGEWHRARRVADPLSVLMIDVDHFKCVNDLHGHAVGDVVLKAVAGLLKARIRKTDLLARYGGEEFVLALPGTTLAEGESIAESIRRSIEEANVQHPGMEDKSCIRMTVSVGVAVNMLADDTPETLINRADTGLLEAKAAGRNRVVAK